MNKIFLAGVMVTVLAGGAYAGWLGGWGQKPMTGSPVGVSQAQSAAPVQLPSMISGTLPPGHPMNIQSFDRVMGQAEAPVTIIEYASLTCPHCARFHHDVLPQIQKEWIDTGKAKYVLRDLPWDNLALGMAKITRCADSAMYYPLVGAFFESQKAIVEGVDTLGEIKKVARLAGLDSTKVDACIQDAESHKLIVGIKDNALGQLGVQGTPTTFVNGIKLDGEVPYADVKKALEQAYSAVMVAQKERPVKVLDPHISAPQGQGGTPIGQ